MGRTGREDTSPTEAILEILQNEDDAVNAGTLVTERLEELGLDFDEEEIENLREEADGMKAKWMREREVIQEIRDLGVVFLDPLDADTDDDKRSDGEEAELVDVEAERWIVRVTGETPYRVFSDPTQADADFDTLVDGDERTARSGTDPANADTDGDGRSDAEEVARGTNPLAEDFRVTVRYHRFDIDSDCEDSSDVDNAGEFDFNLGVRVPTSGSITPIVSPGALSSRGLVDTCTGSRDTQCYGFTFDDNGDFYSWIQLDDGDGFQDILDFDSFQTSFGINASQEFALAGFVREIDESGGENFPDARLDFQLDDRFNQTLDVNGTMRNGFFTGSELSDPSSVSTSTRPSRSTRRSWVRFSSTS